MSMSTRRNRRAGVEDRWKKADGTASANSGNGKRWRARYVDDDGREHSKSFVRKVDAEKWLQGIIVSQVTGDYVDPVLGQTTFASFYSEWAPRQVWEPGTVRSMNLSASGVTFGSVGLASLRPSHIESWIAALREQGLEASTIRTRFVNVRSVLRAAVRDRLLPRDPSDNVTLPRIRKAEAAMEIPDPHSVATIIAAGTDEMEAFIPVCAFLGTRAGEAAALQVGDIDFLRRSVRIERQAQRENGAIAIRPPKYGSERNVPAPALLLDVLAEHIRLRCPGTEPTRWLFPSWADKSEPISANAAGHRWRKVCKIAGVDTLVLHDLRHFYASALIAAGLDVVAVQRALGHSSPAVTLSTYAHLWKDGEDRIREAANGLVAQVYERPTADALRTDGSKSAADL